MISVIVPVYNVEKYLKRCIDSIINQTYKDLEIILIDDGSIDSSGKICDEYGKRDNRIKVKHIKNSGASVARNVGLDMACGDYISFIDSDDWILPGFLEKLIKLCNEYDSDIAKCETIDVNDSNYSIDTYKIETKLYTSEEIIKTIYKKPKLFNVAVMNKLYKKSIFQNLRFKEGIINEDEEILCKIILNAKKIVVTNEILYCYFLSQNSVTRSEFRIENLNILNLFEERMDLLKKNGFIDLYKQAQAQYMRIIGNFYYNVSESNWQNKEKYLANLTDRKNNIEKEIISNEYFSIKDKIKLILCFNFKHMLKFIYYFKIK